MIHEEICTYEVCKLAKKKGFNCEVYNYYQATKHYCETLRGIVLHSECWKLETDDCYSRYNKGSEDIVSAPTQSLLRRWLREERGIQIYIDSDLDFDDETFVYEWQIANKENFDNGGFEIHRYNSDESHSTYELALEDALKYALEKLV
jgi:hypothetical protein